MIVDEGVTERKLGVIGVDEEPEKSPETNPLDEAKPEIAPKTKRRRKKPADDDDNGFIGSLI